MCGILGIFSKNGLDHLDSSKIDPLLQHRGPDACGKYISPDNKLLLQHYRLSIIDLSEQANQPMFSACGKYVIVFNGEIYNYKELKQKLPHFLWRTQSDTELIIELYSSFGEQVFSWLNGMFAIAIYHIETRELVISRDHIGIKPLFYFWDEQTFIFASEIKAIKALLSHNPTIDLSVIPYFLHLGFIPEPLSIYQNIYKFPSASSSKVSLSDYQKKDKILPTTRFWKLNSSFKEKQISNYSKASNHLEELLFDAVEKQLVSDVPIGTFLSGGIDSSLVTAIAATIKKDSVNTFSIGYDDPGYDESIYAERVAKHLNTNHHNININQEHILELLPKLLSTYDEPFSDTSAYPTMIISKFAKKHVSVALTGEGGDELFFGYGSYNWAKRLNNPLIRTFRHQLYQLTKIGDNRIKRGGLLLNYNTTETNLQSHIFSQENYMFAQQEIRDYLKCNVSDFNLINCSYESERILNKTEKQSLWDINYYLKDDLLVKVDRASMLYSLEARVPLLDYRIVEFASNLKEDFKLRGADTKFILKDVLYKFVPKEFFDRPKKGFSIPLQVWLKKEWKFLIDKYLSKACIECYNLVHYDRVELLKKRFFSGENYLYGRIWVLIVLHWWLEENA